MPYDDRYPLKDYLNSINFNKENLLEREGYGKHYPPYIINKCLSGFMDTVIYSNEMNRLHHASKHMQFSFFLNSIKSRKRFSKWLKSSKMKNLDVVKQHFGYSNKRAQEALSILTKEKIDYIKERLYKGGKK